MFLIGNKLEPHEFWSNEDGWVDQDDADLFDRDEQKYLNLPTEGYWVPLWSIDLTQFARFIAECEAAGIFNDDEERLNQVAESMDLEFDQVLSIIDRAQNRWDEEKQRVLDKNS